MDPIVQACPFCQAANCRPFECDVDAWAVACAECQAIGPAAPSAPTAIERWNAAAVGDDKTKMRAATF